jgi:hypothetical protein
VKKSDLHLEVVNAKLTEALTKAVREVHGQSAGVRVIQIKLTKTDLNPPGRLYDIVASVQITFKNEENPPEG